MRALLLALSFQCPDGSPPPCARPAQIAASTAPDPRRIAILPFRVTTADSLLGEGFAELVATEFTGENSPRAVNMGTVLRAWRGAGGGPRSPLTQTQALRLARSLGAGLYIEGSVVGAGERLTINASVVTVPAGASRRTGQVSGTADSLDVLAARVTSGLLASAGGVASTDSRTRYTDSPVAMRAYLEGLAYWRASRVDAAGRAFEQALAEDSTFARAALMRWHLASWIGDGAWNARVRALAGRLSVHDRMLVETMLSAPARRTPSQALAARVQLAERLPESAEAQYFAGDYLYHSGRMAGVLDNLERARAYFERSVAIDSQGSVLQHLLELAFETHDTALVRRTWPAVSRTVNAWDWGMAVASLLGDDAMYQAQRARAEAFDNRMTASQALITAGLPASRTDEILDHLARFSTTASNRTFFSQTAAIEAFVVQGRPAAAAAAARDARGEAHRTLGPTTLDELVVFAALFGDGPHPAAVDAAERLSRVTEPADRTRTACTLALWSFVARGERPAAPLPDPARLRSAACQAVLTAAMAVQDRHADAPGLLAAADSALRDVAALGDPLLEASALLARGYETLGNLPAALAMRRTRLFGFMQGWSAPVRDREEGRLAALLGDTTAAIRAYRHYLRLRRDAEPVLVPQRDSVRAELNRLLGQ